MLSELFERRLRAWVSEMEADRLAPRTVSFYKETIRAVAGLLESHGIPYMPRAVKPGDAGAFLDLMAGAGFAVQTRKGYWTALRKWCREGGNRTVDSWPKPRFPADTRPKADWLTADEARRLLEADLTELQRLVVTLELRQGFRHVEVIRLRMDDVDWTEELLLVTGKGPVGGKPRTVPMLPDTADALEAWLSVRRAWAAEGAERYPRTFEDPPQVVVWRKAGRLRPYSEEGYGLDKMVVLPLSRELGFHFSNHTLRRTFGRALYRSGVPPATIARILGHASTEETLRYIGVDLDDMREAMGRLL